MWSAKRIEAARCPADARRERQSPASKPTAFDQHPEKSRHDAKFGRLDDERRERANMRLGGDERRQRQPANIVRGNAADKMRVNLVAKAMKFSGRRRLEAAIAASRLHTKSAEKRRARRGKASSIANSRLCKLTALFAPQSLAKRATLFARRSRAADARARANLLDAACNRGGGDRGAIVVGRIDGYACWRAFDANARRRRHVRQHEQLSATAQQKLNLRARARRVTRGARRAARRRRIFKSQAAC